MGQAKLRKAEIDAVKMKKTMDQIAPGSWYFKFNIQGPSSGVHAWSTPNELEPLNAKSKLLKDVHDNRGRIRGVTPAQEDLVHATNLFAQLAANDGIKEIGNPMFGLASAMLQPMMKRINSLARQVVVTVTSVPHPMNSAYSTADQWAVGYGRGQGVDLLDADGQVLWSFRPVA